MTNWAWSSLLVLPSHLWIKDILLSTVTDVSKVSSVLGLSTSSLNNGDMFGVLVVASALSIQTNSKRDMRNLIRAEQSSKPLQRILGKQQQDSGKRGTCYITYSGFPRANLPSDVEDDVPLPACRKIQYQSTGLFYMEWANMSLCSLPPAIKCLRLTLNFAVQIPGFI